MRGLSGNRTGHSEPTTEKMSKGVWRRTERIVSRSAWKYRGAPRANVQTTTESVAPLEVIEGPM
jgi:hypothetical protein